MGPGLGRGPPWRIRRDRQLRARPGALRRRHVGRSENGGVSVMATRGELSG
jgi:hypothetical protein